MKEFKLLVASDNEDLNQKAIKLSKKIKLPFAGRLEDLKKNPQFKIQLIWVTFYLKKI